MLVCTCIALSKSVLYAIKMYYITPNARTIFFDLNKESRSNVQAMVNEENYFLYYNLKREAMPQGRP